MKKIEVYGAENLSNILVFLSKRDKFLSGHAVSPKTKLIINEVFDSLSS